MQPNELERLTYGKLPYGKFSEYIRANPPLQKACGGFDGGGGFDAGTARNRNSYLRLFKLYQTAVQKASSTNSAVAEVKECALAEPADDAYYAKFRCKKPRVGSQYFDRNFKFVRDADLRRGRGGGRLRVCVVLKC